MGTSGAYAGSKGKGTWDAARDAARSLADGGSTAGGGPTQPDDVIRAIMRGLGAAGAGIGLSRNQQNAANVGARAIGAGLGLAAAAGTGGATDADRALVEEAGLSIDELTGLGEHDQCARIVESLLDGDTIIDSELGYASTEVLLLLLTGEISSPEEAIRAFVVAYCHQVLCTEVAAQLRSNDDPGQGLRLEQELRDHLEAVVAGLLIDTLPGSTVSVGSLEAAIGAVMTEVRHVFDLPNDGKPT